MSESFNFGSLKKSKPKEARKAKPVEKVKTQPIESKVLKKIQKHVKTVKMDFNSFMCKLEDSNSYASRHLKEKIGVKGTYKQANKERVIRVIRDVIDVINE